MERITILALVACACFVVALLPWFLKEEIGEAFAGPYGPPLGTILIIRHAEKPLLGIGLTPAGSQRAQSYVSYFQHFQIDGQPLSITALVASADTLQSQRPRLTLEPLSKALHLEIQQPFEDKDVAGLTAWLRSYEAPQATLVAWHHGQIPNILRQLGVDPATVLPGGVWPDDVYDWVIVLRYDPHGILADARRVTEQV